MKFECEMERKGGGRCWFVVDLKSFEILINNVGGEATWYHLGEK